MGLGLPPKSLGEIRCQLPQHCLVQGEKVGQGQGPVLRIRGSADGIGGLYRPGGIHMGAAFPGGNLQGGNPCRVFRESDHQVLPGQGEPVGLIQGLFRLIPGHTGKLHRAHRHPGQDLPPVGIPEGEYAENGQDDHTKGRRPTEERLQPLGSSPGLFCVLARLFFGFFRCFRLRCRFRRFRCFILRTGLVSRFSQQVLQRCQKGIVIHFFLGEQYIFLHRPSLLKNRSDYGTGKVYHKEPGRTTCFM